MASDGDNSLMSSGHSTTSSDISMVETLTKEGTRLMSKKRLRRSIKKYTEAYMVAERLGDDVALQSCACNLGAALIAKGDAEQAVQYLENALPRGHNNSRNGKHSDGILADLHYNLGLGYSVLGSTKHAKKHFTKSIELFIACDDVRAFAEGYHQLGAQYLHDQQLMTAATCFEESSKAFGTINDLFSEVKMRLKQGECLVLHGKEKKGLKVAKACDIICEALLIGSINIALDPGKKARCFHDLGILHSKLNSHESASRWYEAALLNMRSANVKGAGNQEARILENLGLTCNIIQQYSRAIQLHKEAASLHGTLGNSTERGWCFYHLAEAYRNLGQHADAERTYHVAYQIFEDAGESHWQWKVQVGLGDLSYDRRNLDTAVGFYKDALKQLSQERNEDCKPFETHVMEKLVLSLQVQRAGIVRMASYKKRKPVLINPQLETLVLESMSSALQHSMTFEEEELPKLPTLDPNDDVQNYEPLSPTFSPRTNGHRSNYRPLTYGAAIPSPIIESPSPLPYGKPVHRSVERQDSNFLKSPSKINHRKSRKQLKVGRRRRPSHDAPVAQGTDVYSSHTDLSLVDAGEAQDLRLAAAYAEQLRKAEKKRHQKNKGIATKLAEKVAGARGGRRRKLDDDKERPDRIMKGLEYGGDRHGSRQRPKSSRKKRVSQMMTSTVDDETGDTMASTSTGSYTSHGNSSSAMTSSASTLTSVSPDDDDDNIYESSDEDTVQGMTSSDEETENSESGSESSEDEWDEDGETSDSSDASLGMSGTYEKPLNLEDPPYATIRSIRSKGSPRTPSTEPLYETLNSVRISNNYSLASTAPLRDPDSPPPPLPPSSQRPSQRHAPHGLHREEEDPDKDWHLSREIYPASPIMEEESRASREVAMYHISRRDYERRRYVKRLQNEKNMNSKKGTNLNSNVMEDSDDEEHYNKKKRNSVTSAMCSVM